LNSPNTATLRALGARQAKLHAGDAVVFGGMGAHAPPDVVVVAFGKQQPVELPHPLVAERPGVVLDMLNTAAANAHLVGRAGIVIQGQLKHPGMVGRGHGQALAIDQQLNLLGLRHPDPHHPAASLQGLGAKNGQGWSWRHSANLWASSTIQSSRTSTGIRAATWQGA
jgi:hypothetical protein